MVRGFVEEQQLGARGEDAGEGEPRLLAAGERADAALVRDVAEAETVQRRVHAGVGLVAAPFLVPCGEFAVREEFLGCRAAERLLGGLHLPFHGTEFGERRVDGGPHGVLGPEAEGLGERLREMRDAAGEADGHLPAVGLLGPGQEPEQRGLAGAVLTDDGGLLTGADGERELFEDGAVPIGLGGVFQGQLGAVAHGIFPWVLGCVRTGGRDTGTTTAAPEGRRISGSDRVRGRNQRKK